MFLAHRIVFLLFCLVAACADGGDPCLGTETRCVGNAFQICQGEAFVDSEFCGDGMTCNPASGCGTSSCTPGATAVCQGSDVYECLPDGSLGGFVTSCVGSCGNGACVNDDCGADGAELIYLVDDESHLYSFDPRGLGSVGDPYSLIGTLNCPAGPPLQDGPGGTVATPFSMSVDRTGRAWVLYSSGEIFWVSTADASCQKSTFVPGSSGFQLFGMGFVSDSAGSSAETLYIAGGSATLFGSGNLGSINPTTMAVSSLGALPDAEYSPEMTGTGEGELYGYYPGIGSSQVALINKINATNQNAWPLPAANGIIAAWAFAHWGGDFFIFLTTTDLLSGSISADVLRLDPTTGNAPRVITNTGRRVVGAGVSTCAPVIVE